MTTIDPPHLILRSATEIKRILLTERTSWTFGRSQTNTVRLNDPAVSRYHAKLETVNGRHFCFVDLNSRNGSLINGEPLTAPTLLKHGDCIRIGATDVIFHRGTITLSGHPSSVPSQQVLMLQASAVQGIIWQELLLSQGIVVIWETSGVNLEARLQRDAADQKLPKLLLMDVKAYPGMPFEFCQRCRLRYPQLGVVLVDSSRQTITLDERQRAIAQGCVNLFPAFHHRHLVRNVAEVVVRLNVVLQSFERQPLEQSKLLAALESLDALLNKVPTLVLAAPSLGIGNGWQVEPEEDITSFMQPNPHP